MEAFKEKIKELETNIYKANNIEEIKHHETNFVESWKSCKKDYYKVLKEARIKCVLGNLSTLIALLFAKDTLNAIGLNLLTEHIQICKDKVAELCENIPADCDSRVKLYFIKDVLNYLYNS